jgi:membrane protein required for colicin V production
MIIDTLVFGLLAVAVYKGYTKGLIVAVFSFLGLVVGLLAAVKFSAIVAGWLGTQVGTAKQWVPTLSFAIVFIAAVFLVRQGAAVVQKLVQMALLGWVNRIGGILFFGLLYMAIISVFLFYTTQLQFFSADTIAQSKTYSIVQPYGPAVIDGFGYVVPIFKNLFIQLQDFFEAVKIKAAKP